MQVNLQEKLLIQVNTLYSIGGQKTQGTRDNPDYIEIRDYTKIIHYTPGKVMGQALITRKPPHYLPEILGELIFGISGNDYLFITCQKFLGI